VTPNTIDFDQVQLGFRSINNPGDVPVIVAVLVVLLLYLTAVVFARRADKRDLEKVHLLNVMYIKKYMYVLYNSIGHMLHHRPHHIPH